MKRNYLLLLLLGHTIVTAYVFYKVGVLSVFPPYQELHTWQIFSDLFVSLGIILLLFYVEVKRKKQKLGPLIVCAIGMYFLGSFSPLIFLLVKKDLFVEERT